ncbi:AGAP007259-PA-like protein [Anopheles sinensis]|uniref:AGAP007259-PA-like protein n=1 Tax=Anopheles sinensis TaxID=74873 RepID=A0A084VQU8_ANOSI|nr:AGAP007259-PA-like protein [Anopheles sinensis]
MYLRLLCSLVLVAVFHVATIDGQSYEDKRCKCICPSITTIDNTTQESAGRMLIIDNVPPNKCNCDGVILPRIAGKIKGKGTEICPRCDCKYENRNTTIIKVVVIIVIWIISLLVIYMLFLMCLDPLLNKRVKANYQEHTNEDDDTAVTVGNGQDMHVRDSNVLNRVGHQQDKWKRQVREQRRNIYDRHTMLN